MNLVIDATSKISGGGRIHLKNLIELFSPKKHHFSKIYLFAPSEFISTINLNDNIIDCSNTFINKGSLGILFWRLFLRNNEFSNISSKCIFSPFGDYFGGTIPYVSMSQNMLIFDEDQRKLFKFSITRIKLEILYFFQLKSFNNAKGIIFLSNYALNHIKKFLKNNKQNFRVINHGINEELFKLPSVQKSINHYSFKKPFKFLYVSNILPYKHHLNVVSSIFELRKEGYPVSLTLLGKIDDFSIAKNLKNKIDDINNEFEIIDWYQNIKFDSISDYYHNSDCFIFASSCENMPNILIEAMASGLPLICSKCEPMPEFLEDNGYYFDPYSVKSLKNEILNMLNNHELRHNHCKNSYKLSKKYSWLRCADETFNFLSENIKQ